MTIGETFREWDELDFLAVGGMLVLTGGVVASLVPRLRKIQVLFPIAIGAVMMAIAAYGARYSYGKGISDEGDDATPSSLGDQWNSERIPKTTATHYDHSD